jgi:hypothetical protein
LRRALIAAQRVRGEIPALSAATETWLPARSSAAIRSAISGVSFVGRPRFRRFSAAILTPRFWRIFFAASVPAGVLGIGRGGAPQVTELHPRLRRGSAVYLAGMRRWRVALAGLVAALALSGTAALAAPPPSERACLLAWNGQGNAGNRTRVVASGPWSSASLHPGLTGNVTWKRGTPPAQTTAEPCLLTLVKAQRIQPVTGVWRQGRVVRWAFGRAIAIDKLPGRSNIKVLPDGRVTKIYLR